MHVRYFTVYVVHERGYVSNGTGSSLFQSSSTFLRAMRISTENVLSEMVGGVVVADESTVSRQEEAGHFFKSSSSSSFGFSYSCQCRPSRGVLAPVAMVGMGSGTKLWANGGPATTTQQQQQ